MRLYKRERSPYWWAEFTVEGKQYRISTKRPLTDKKGAQRVMAEEYARLSNASQFGAMPEITLEEAMDATIKTVQGRTRITASITKRRLLGLDRFDKEGFYRLDGKMKLSGLRQHHIDDLVQARLDEGLKPNTVRIEVRFLLKMHNIMKRRYAVNDKLEFHMPKAFHKTRWLSDQEEDAILERLRSQRRPTTSAPDHAIDLYIYLVDTGVRIGEALDAEWADINLSRMTIDVFRPKTKILSVVPISDRLAEVLRRRHNMKKPFMKMSYPVRLLREAIDAECNQNKRIVETRGSATIHTLRDTFASRMVKRGLSLHKVSKLLGHTSPAMTAKYAQLEAQDVVEQARALLNNAA